ARATSATTGMPLRADLGALERTQARIHARQTLHRAHIAPLAAMHLAAHRSCRDGAIQQRQERKSPGGAAAEDLRPGHARPGIGVTIGVATHHEITLESEVAPRVVRRVGY